MQPIVVDSDGRISGKGWGYPDESGKLYSRLKNTAANNRITYSFVFKG
jgi:hypothetical protein